MKSELTTLLFTIIREGKADIPESRIPDLLKLISRIDYGGIIYVKSEHKALPPEIFDYAKLAYYRNFVRNNLYIQKFREIEQIFIQNGINYQPLKGIWLLNHIYPHILGIRSLSDIDVLISPAQMELATKVLTENGFELKRYIENQRNQSQESFCKNNIKLDLHYEIKELEHIDISLLKNLSENQQIAIHYVIHIMHLFRHLRSQLYRPIWVNDCYEILQLLEGRYIEVNLTYLSDKQIEEFNFIHSYIQHSYLSVNTPYHVLHYLFHENARISELRIKWLTYRALIQYTLKLRYVYLKKVCASDIALAKKILIINRFFMVNLKNASKLLKRLTSDFISYFWMKIKLALKIE